MAEALFTDKIALHTPQLVMGIISTVVDGQHAECFKPVVEKLKSDGNGSVGDHARMVAGR